MMALPLLAGDQAMRADFLRGGYNLNGDSTTIGVLSDSYNTIPGNPAQVDVNNRDLPGTGNPLNPDTVTMLKDTPLSKMVRRRKSHIADHS